MRIAGISATCDNLGNNQLKNQNRTQHPSFGNYEYAQDVMKIFHEVQNINPHMKLTQTVNGLHNKKIPFRAFVLFDQVEALRNHPLCKNLGKEFEDLTVYILKIVDQKGENNVYKQEMVLNPTTQDYYLQDVGEPIGTVPTRSVLIQYSIPALEKALQKCQFTETVPINNSDISGTLSELLDREEFTFNNLSGALEKIQKKVDGIVSSLATQLTKESAAATRIEQ